MSEMNEYTPELYTLTDEEGHEQTFELLDVVEIEDQRYYALIPQLDDPESLTDDDGEFVILKSDIVDDEEMLVSIEDEDEFNAVGEIFIKRLEEMFEEDECDCEDDDCDCCH